jgi:hypothetical protein
MAQGNDIFCFWNWNAFTFELVLRDKLEFSRQSRKVRIFWEEGAILAKP